MSNQVKISEWREKLHEIIFEADTPVGKLFDELLIVTIILSVIVVMLDSIEWIRDDYQRLLYYLEWVFTIIFSIEYVLRLICVRRPAKYATSFYGMVDLLTVIPTYLDLVFPGTRFLLVIRILRVLRIFRILKLAKYIGEANSLIRALRASSRKTMVFLFAVTTIVVILGSIMYVIEGEGHGFTSIPFSIYWAIVTLTTVGYGDIAPQTSLGQAVSIVVMMLGYSIIAVPAGIVSVELSQVFTRGISTQACRYCSAEGHDEDAIHCKFCGEQL